jgi:hypothetical protein
MTDQFEHMQKKDKRRVLVGAALQAAEQHGLTLTKLPGRGKSNVWEARGNGKSQRISIRTSKNRWFAFPPLNRGKKWKTLDDVDVVMVAAVDNRDDPRRAMVYRFDAKEVRKHFDAAYAARASAGRTIKDGFGMWINLDDDRRRTPVSVGAGLAAAHKPISVFTIDELLASTANVDVDEESEDEGDTTGPETIAEVIDWARQHIAQFSGVPAESVKLDLKIEY